MGTPPRRHRATDTGRHRPPLSRTLATPVQDLSRRVARQRPPVESSAAVPAQSAIVDCALYQDGVRQGGRVPLEHACETARAAGDGGFVWIGLHEPTHAEFDAVTHEFGLHPLAVEDAVHAHQRPKIEVYDDLVFVVLKTARYVDSVEAVEIGELMLFLGAGFVITVRHGSASELTHVRHDLEARPDLMRLGPSAVFYAVADRVVDDYTSAVSGISNDIEEVELQVFSTRDNPTERLYKLKREVLEFRRAVAPLAVPLDRVTDGKIAMVPEVARAYFRDVHDHVLRAAEQIDAFDELLSGALAANVAQIQTRDNEDMRKITAWVAILAANTLVAGIYGMNFENMPELGWKFGYPMALGLMMLFSVLLYRGFRRNSWL